MLFIEIGLLLWNVVWCLFGIRRNPATVTGFKCRLLEFIIFIKNPLLNNCLIICVFTFSCFHELCKKKVCFNINHCRCHVNFLFICVCILQNCVLLLPCWCCFAQSIIFVIAWLLGKIRSLPTYFSITNIILIIPTLSISTCVLHILSKLAFYYF